MRSRAPLGFGHRIIGKRIGGRARVFCAVPIPQMAGQSKGIDAIPFPIFFFVHRVLFGMAAKRNTEPRPAQRHRPPIARLLLAPGFTFTIDLRPKPNVGGL